MRIDIVLADEETKELMALGRFEQLMMEVGETICQAVLQEKAEQSNQPVLTGDVKERNLGVIGRWVTTREAATW